MEVALRGHGGVRRRERAAPEGRSTYRAGLHLPSELRRCLSRGDPAVLGCARVDRSGAHAGGRMASTRWAATWLFGTATLSLACVDALRLEPPTPAGTGGAPASSSQTGMGGGGGGAAIACASNSDCPEPTSASCSPIVVCVPARCARRARAFALIRSSIADRTCAKTSPPRKSTAGSVTTRASVRVPPALASMRGSLLAKKTRLRPATSTWRCGPAPRWWCGVVSITRALPARRRRARSTIPSRSPGRRRRWSARRRTDTPRRRSGRGRRCWFGAAETLKASPLATAPASISRKTLGPRCR